MSQLARDHAPILWLHENEVFFPVDVQAAIEHSDLLRKGKPAGQVPDLEALGQIKKSEETELKLRKLNNHDFNGPSFDGLSGPSAIKAQARRLYGRCLPAHGAQTDVLNQVKCYARVSEVRLKPRGHPIVDRRLKKFDPQIFGRYDLIEYFFYFVYNDGWNQHQGDWDCQIYLYIRRGDGRMFMVNRLHHDDWATVVSAGPPARIRDWVDGWNTRAKHEVGQAYALNGHPFVFVAQGGHGGYPTPGATAHGLKVKPVGQVLLNTDDRQIARNCILPDGASDEELRALLAASDISDQQLVTGRWTAPELVLEKNPTQPWLRYKGRWGQNSKYLGHAGPKRPPITKKPVKQMLRDSLWKVLAEGYSAGAPLDSWHGV